MRFQYTARLKSGETQEGNVYADSRDEALRILEGHELYVLALQEVRLPKWYTNLVAFFNRVRRKDVMIFTRQLAAMLEAGMPLADALRILYRQTRNQYFKEVIFDMSTDIDAGLSFSQALARRGEIFSDFYVNLVRSAEVTGRVQEVMNFLADYLEEQLVLIGKIRSAMVYPAFVSSLFAVVVAILLGLVFPQIGPIFTESGADLPFVTEFFLNLGTFIANWWIALIIAFITLLVVVIDYFRSKEGRLVWDVIVLRLPVFGPLFGKVYIARFAEGMRILIKGGIPITDALEISAKTIGSATYAEEVLMIAQSVRGGELLSNTLQSRPDYFPNLVSQMVAVGENTGRTEDMFERIGTFYTREVNDVVKNLVELIQPVLMVVLGVLVGALFASLLVPIYNLVQVF